MNSLKLIRYQNFLLTIHYFSQITQQTIKDLSFAVPAKLLVNSVVTSLEILQIIKNLQNDNKMKSVCILVCLGIIYGAYSVVILQSTTATSIVLPLNSSTLLSTYFNTNRKDAAGTGVQWITSSSRRSPTHYQNLFYSSCVGKATLTITAANSFNAYLDGVLIGTGANSSAVFTFSVSITCGNHNFTVIVFSTPRVSEGLTFAIDQDQSNCYNCQATGFWNEYTCACACITSQCKCTAPKVWKPYPICGCGCRPRPIFEINQVRCIYPRYYNAESCSCACHYKYCPPGQYFNELACQCYTLIS